MFRTSTKLSINPKITNRLLAGLIFPVCLIGYSSQAQAFNIGFQTEIKLNNNDGINDSFSIYNTSDSNTLSITKVKFTLGDNAELDTTSHGFPTLNTATTNNHWGPTINSSNSGGLITSLGSFADASNVLTFDFIPGQFVAGAGFAINIDFDKRNQPNVDPSGADWSNAQIDVTFTDGSSTQDLTYLYGIQGGGGKSFPTDETKGNTTPITGQFCPKICQYSTSTKNFQYPYAEFVPQEIPFEFSPSLGLLISLGTFGGYELWKRHLKQV
jgi:hypothetical protein